MKYNVNFKDLGLRDYKEAWDYQAELFNNIIERKTTDREIRLNENQDFPGTLFFVEHPHVYTLGKSGSENNFLMDLVKMRAMDAEFYRTDRGGDITYHGPGQIVGYPVFDLEIIGIGLKEYINRLEEAIIKSIGELGLFGSRLKGGTGVWLDAGVEGVERKICAIGVKASRFVTMHGFALNVNTDLTYFDYINPCGFKDKGVTSLEKELNAKQDFERVKHIVREKLGEVFDLEWV